MCTAHPCPLDLDNLLSCFDTVVTGEPAEWPPLYNITGEFYVDGGKVDVKQYDNGEILRTHKTSTYAHVLRGYYTNATHVVGIQTYSNLVTGCVAVQHIRLDVRADRSYCSQTQLSPLSLPCELKYGTIYPFCIEY